MITKTYICDITGKSVGEMDLCQIKVDLEIPKGVGGYARYKSVTKHVCKDELIRRGFMVVSKDSEKSQELEEKARKTFEDKFLDLLSDLGVLFEE